MHETTTRDGTPVREWTGGLLDRISPRLAAALIALRLRPPGADRRRRHPRVGHRVLGKDEIRALLRRRGYSRICRLRLDRHAYVVRAWDRYGRRVRLRLNPFTGQEIRRPGYGLAWLTPAAVEDRLARHGFRRVSGLVLRDGAYFASAEGPDGWCRAVRVDALSGTIWY